jgi:hypothetical protein
VFVLLTPLHDERTAVPGLVAAVRASRWRPDRWLVVDDRSGDGCAERLVELAGDLPVQVVRREGADGYMGFHYAEALRFGLDAVGVGDADFVGMLDADARFGPDYWDRLRRAMQADTELGIVSGAAASWSEGAWRLEGGQRIDWPRGTGRLLTGACFEAVGGIPLARAPDSVQSVLARAAGWRTAMLPEAALLLLRGTDARVSAYAGAASRGRRAWNVGQPAWYVGARAAVRLLRRRPAEAAGLVAGYAGERGGARVEHPEVGRYYRRERPQDWLRSARARLFDRPDPHARLQQRPVQLAALQLPASVLDEVAVVQGGGSI